MITQIKETHKRTSYEKKDKRKDDEFSRWLAGRGGEANTFANDAPDEPSVRDIYKPKIAMETLLALSEELKERTQAAPVPIHQERSFDRRHHNKLSDDRQMAFDFLKSKYERIRNL